MLKAMLAHPLTRGLDLDSPETTELRVRIIRGKPFLQRVYENWYQRLAESLPEGEGGVLELGSGGGFLKEWIPELTTSDILPLAGVDLVLDAHYMDFADGDLRGIVMTNVLHHLPDVKQFFREAARCVRPGGVMAMIEPWVSPFSRIIYRRLHHEPFDPSAKTWTFPMDGPLSGANGALPWIVFQRDREIFERENPQWIIRKVEPFMPFNYLLSGGVSMRSLMPSWSYGFWSGVERMLPGRRGWAMFAHLVIERRSEEP